MTIIDARNEELWVSALQGGAYSSYTQVNRFFMARDLNTIPTLRAALGGNFRTASQTAASPNLGRLRLGTLESVAGVVPIGVVELEDRASYFFASVNAADEILSVSRYDSIYSNELTSSTSQVVWTPSVALHMRVVDGMRIVQTSTGVYLYYADPISGKTRLFVTELPPTGTAREPKLVQVYDFEVSDRIYVVPDTEPGRVSIYVGPSDLTAARFTSVTVHTPRTNEINHGPQTVFEGASPFPRSYAACLGRNEWGLGTTVVMLESRRSRDEGGAGLFSFGRGGAGSSTIESGMEWLLVVFSANGRTLIDQALITQDFMGGWGGKTFAASNGGISRTVCVPNFLSRAAPTSETHDVSTEYSIHARIHLRTDIEGSNPYDTKFYLAKDADASLSIADQPMLGDISSLRRISESTTPSLLVPGSLSLEYAGGVNTEGGYVSTIGYFGNQIGSWAMKDNSASSGQDSSNPPPGDTPPVNHNVATDAVMGVKAQLIDTDSLFIVGWFTSGDNS